MVVSILFANSVLDFLVPFLDGTTTIIGCGIPKPGKQSCSISELGLNSSSIFVGTINSPFSVLNVTN
jgi:hypothetical protein